MKLDLKSKRRIKELITTAIILCIIGFSCIYFSLTYHKEKKLIFNNNVNIEYKLLNAKGKSVKNGSEIKDIKIKYLYQYKAKNKIDLKASYKIYGILKIKGNDSSSSLQRNIDIVSDTSLDKKNTREYNLEKEITLDYQNYLDFFGNFKDDAGSNVQSELEVYLVVNNNDVPYEIKSIIPLTDKKVSIKEDKDTDKKEMISSSSLKISNYLFLVSGIIILIISIIDVIYTIYYSINNSLSSNQYTRYVDHILKKYDDEIVEGEITINLEDYTIIKLSKFKELLDVKHTLNEPIIYNKLSSKKEAMFFIKKEHDLYLFEIGEDDFKDS